MPDPARAGPSIAQARSAQSHYTRARCGPPGRFTMPARPGPTWSDTAHKYFFYKNIHAMELNDHLHSISEHGKEFSTMLIMSVIRPAKFNACKAI